MKELKKSVLRTRNIFSVHLLDTTLKMYIYTLKMYTFDVRTYREKKMYVDNNNTKNFCLYENDLEETRASRETPLVISKI